MLPSMEQFLVHYLELAMLLVIVAGYWIGGSRSAPLASAWPREASLGKMFKP